MFIQCLGHFSSLTPPPFSTPLSPAPSLIPPYPSLPGRNYSALISKSAGFLRQSPIASASEFPSAELWISLYLPPIKVKATLLKNEERTLVEGYKDSTVTRIHWFL
jgi:hypothetical protein